MQNKSVGVDLRFAAKNNAHLCLWSGAPYLWPGFQEGQNNKALLFPFSRLIVQNDIIIKIENQIRTKFVCEKY